MDGATPKKKRISLRMMSSGSSKEKERRRAHLARNIVWHGFQNMD